MNDPAMPESSDYGPEGLTLACGICGNQHRFEEVVDFSVNMVTGNMSYVRSLWSEVDCYRCFVCGAEVVPAEKTRDV